MTDKRCANKTCTRIVRGAGKFCCRECLLAARNPTHRKTLQIDVPMDLYHALKAEAAIDQITFADAVRDAISDYVLL